LGSPKDGSQAVLNDAAKQLGVKPSALSAALKKALENRVDDAVAAGRLTKEQGAELKQRIESGDLPLLGLPLLGARGFPHFGPHEFGFFGRLDAAASYLGLTETQLESRLNDGKTLAEVAKAQGKSADGLVDALYNAEKKKLDDAVAAGRLTKAQGDELKQRIESGDVPLFGGPGHGFHERGALFGGLDAAASYLGLTEDQLRAQFQNGKSLADVAKAQGKSVDGLIQAIVGDAKKKLNAAVSAGRLTQTQADSILAGLKARVSDFVNRTPPRFGFRHAFPGRGLGGGPPAAPEPGFDGPAI
jgi:predicted DNA-binding protein (UPF0251 family)